MIENDLYRITFTNRGGQAKSWILKKYFDDQGRPLDLVNQVALQNWLPALALELDESLRNQLNSALYVASESGTVNAPTNLVFEYSSGGLTVRKELQFDHSYVVHVHTRSHKTATRYTLFHRGLQALEMKPRLTPTRRVNSNTSRTATLNTSAPRRSRTAIPCTEISIGWEPAPRSLARYSYRTTPTTLT